MEASGIRDMKAVPPWNSILVVSNEWTCLHASHCVAALSNTCHVSSLTHRCKWADLHWAQSRVWPAAAAGENLQDTPPLAQPPAHNISFGLDCSPSPFRVYVSPLKLVFTGAGIFMNVAHGLMDRLSFWPAFGVFLGISLWNMFPSSGAEFHTTVALHGDQDGTAGHSTFGDTVIDFMSDSLSLHQEQVVAWKSEFDFQSRQIEIHTCIFPF